MMFLLGYTPFYSYISSNLDIYISILSPFPFQFSIFILQSSIFNSFSPPNRVKTELRQGFNEVFTRSQLANPPTI